MHWKDIVTDDLMIKFTWAGQVENGSKKNPENSSAKSKLASTVWGKNTYSLYRYVTREYNYFLCRGRNALRLRIRELRAYFKDLVDLNLELN